MSLCDPMNYNLPRSSVHGILQASILEWVAMPSSRGSSQLRDQTRVSCVSCVDGWVLFFFLVLFIYLAALGLSCSMWDLAP